MDTYMEYMVKHKKDKKARLCTVGIFTLAVLLTFGMIMLILFAAMVLAQTGISQFAFSIGLVLIAFMWYFAVFFANKFNIEYEYILTNNFMDIDKIMSKSQRKRIISFDFTEIEHCANIKDDAHNDAYKRNDTTRQVYDLTGDIDNGGVYFVDFNTDGQRYRVLFQPTSKMIESVRRFKPGNIFIYEDRF
jgi:hypothetical protein